MSIDTLRPLILRYRTAQQNVDDLKRRLGAAETELAAARQELDDALAQEAVWQVSAPAPIEAPPALEEV